LPKYRFFFVLSIALGMVFILMECANPVSPVGGPEDVKPPGFVKAEPPMYTLNFDADRIRIYFDEFIVFKDLNQQVIISPPMDKKPEFKLKGKSVVIDFEEELKPNTTYNIFFGSAIVDLTENNPATNFQYVFSTGDVLDSLTLKGNVVDALTLEPLPNLNVMLYLDNNDTLPFDSLPYFVKPWYYSKTNEAGDFQFNNLATNDYKLFVLEDANTNLVFDQITERIAFLDSLITPYYIPPPAEPDTSSMISDSSFMETDTLMVLPDTLLPTEDTIPEFIEPDPLKLFLFAEVDSVQRFIKASFVKKGKLMFVFKGPTVSPELNALNLPEPDEWRILESNKSGDTLNLWLRKPVPDTLVFEIVDDGIILDTVEVLTVERKSRREQKKEDDKPEKLQVRWGKKTELNTTQKVQFSYPIKEYNLEGAMMIENEDTLSPSFRISDSIGLTGEFSHAWIENASYQFMVPDSSFFGLGDQSHDTLRHNLKMKELADYGNVYLNITLNNPGIQHIVQLLSEDKLLSEKVIAEDQKVGFEYLLPGTYVVKVILDRNSNNQWDPGHYIRKIQPEDVSYFPKSITVRANWDIVEDWEI
jgi:hypothetical protein